MWLEYFVPYFVAIPINKTNNMVTVRAVFHTSQDPEKWTKRK